MKPEKIPDGHSYVVANCDGCDDNRDADFLTCLQKNCPRLEFPSRSAKLTPLGGSLPGLGAELHEYASPSFGVWGDPAVVLSINIPEGPSIDVWLDKGELLAALGTGDPARPEVVREHVTVEDRHPTRTKCGNTICPVEPGASEDL